MQVCTDRTAFAERLLGGRAAWLPVADADLRAEERSMAAALLTGPERFAARYAVDGAWDRLFVAGLAGRSQFDVLAALINAGVDGGRVLAVAEEGPEFHGWKERRWAAARGNLHLVATRPIAVAAQEGASGLLIAPALALLDAIDGIPGLRGRAGIRWINDVFVGDGKVGGAIVRTWSQGRRLTGAILGIGLDVEATPEVIADRFVPRVRALRELVAPGVVCSLPALFESVTRALARRIDQLEAGGMRELLDAYRRRSLVLGRTVAVYEDGAGGGEIARGKVLGIEEDLALRLAGVAAPIRRGRAALLGARVLGG